MENETKESCEEKGGTWVEQDGAWMCKHPEGSEESPAAPSEDSVEM